MWLLLSTLAFAQAQDWSEITLHTSTPVVVFVDDDPVGVTHPLDPLEVTVEPGEHFVRIQGVLGKHLAEERIELPAGTHTEAFWRSKSLRFAEPWPLPGSDSIDEALPTVAPEDSPEPVEALAALPVQAPLAIPASTPATADPDDFPVMPAPPAPEEAPLDAIAAPPVVPAAPVATTLAPVVPSSPTGLRMEATEGMDLEIWHEDQVLRVQVVDGALVLTQDKRPRPE